MKDHWCDIIVLYILEEFDWLSWRHVLIGDEEISATELSLEGEILTTESNSHSFSSRKISINGAVKTGL